MRLLTSTTLAPEATPTTAPARPWRLLLTVCLMLAAVSLVLPSVPTYDPWAWLIWGRELLHGDLVTTGGPSWKPLPVVFTTPFAALGDGAAPLAWLVVARAGGLLAVAMAWRLGTRLAGPVAGLIAAVALSLSDGFVFNAARANSEGILVAVSLWAVERHLDGRRADAFVLGLAAALLRPEVWPFVALYGIWLLRTVATPRTRRLVLGGGLLVAALWFVPEYLGSGQPLRAATRALEPNADSAAFSTHPFLTVFERSAPMLGVPVYVGAALAVLLAVRHRDRLLVAVAGAAGVLMLTVGVMTQLGFAGNLRYVVLPAALVCVLAGVGWVRVAGAARDRLGDAPAVALLALAAVWALPTLRDELDELGAAADAVRDEAALDGSIAMAIDQATDDAGERAALTDCGTVSTGAFQTTLVAWHLHLHQDDVEVDTTPSPPGTVIAPAFTAMARDPQFPVLAATEHWVVSSTCLES